MRITFDPQEADALREDARDAVADDPTLAYVLLDLADRGLDLSASRSWEDIRAERGLPPVEDAQQAREQRVA
ncbi:hypothetical protein [Kitasatospora sp. NPDC050543]|uniref:hypothetical protein n=1 Tax=Kitasatospora sp. NPDC050543 TaxID=3364054 RepID=UPI0037978A7F